MAALSKWKLCWPLNIDEILLYIICVGTVKRWYFVVTNSTIPVIFMKSDEPQFQVFLFVNIWSSPVIHPINKKRYVTSYWSKFQFHLKYKNRKLALLSDMTFSQNSGLSISTSFKFAIFQPSQSSLMQDLDHRDSLRLLKKRGSTPPAKSKSEKSKSRLQVRYLCTVCRICVPCL